MTNNKGGVTKTTSSINLAFAMTKLEYKVGLIDFDSQKNLSMNLQINSGSDLANCLKAKKLSFEDFAKTENPNVFVLPNKGDVTVSMFNQFPVDEQPYLLLDCLEHLKDDFDFIIIDTPPNLELQTVNSLISCDYCLIPATLETNSIIGVQNTLESINRIKGRLNPRLNLIGVFISKYDERLTMTNTAMTEDLKSLLKNDTLFLNAKIRTNSAFSKNQMELLSIFETDNKKGQEDYIELAKEIIEKTK
jgi:chromosome partitioning protein